MTAVAMMAVMMVVMVTMMTMMVMEMILSESLKPGSSEAFGSSEEHMGQKVWRGPNSVLSYPFWQLRSHRAPAPGRLRLPWPPSPACSHAGAH
ncbi:Hypothetical predicted protein, partial [Marmota monax]